MESTIITIDKSELINRPHTFVPIVIRIGDDPFLVISLRNENDGSLYYLVEECANPDVSIEGHYPEYFPEVTA